MRVSVILPAYNAARFLSEAIESVLRQTVSDFELLAIYEHSHDSTLRVLEAYAKHDSRIRIIHSPEPGLPAALNAGLLCARSELVARLDADDRMLPTRLERQLWFLEHHPDMSVICSYGYFINASGRRIGKAGNSVDAARGRRETDPLLFVQIIHPSVIVKRRDVLAVNGYRNYPFCEDRDLWGRLITGGFQIACQEECLVEFRVHGNSKSVREYAGNINACRWIDHNIIRRLQGQAEMPYDEYLQWFKHQSLRKRLRERSLRRSQAELHVASRYYADRRWFRCAMHVALAMALHPRRVIATLATKVVLRFPVIAE